MMMPSLIRSLCACCALACIVLSPSSASASSRAIDLADGADIVIEGGARQVEEAGDVNGDGTPDLLLHTGSVGGYGPDNGRVYVVFGSHERSRIVLDDLGTYGFVIHGAKPKDYASVARPAGDVNGDGLDDIIVGAPEASAESIGSLKAGAAYVVFGKIDPAPVHLALFDLGIQGPLGFKIEGPRSWSLAGLHVAGAEDVNGDGLDDLIVGAPWQGATYVVFGKTDASRVRLDSFEEDPQGRGFRIETPAPNFAQWYNVAGLGDVNGDGKPDIGISYTTWSINWNFIVFGKADDRPVSIFNEGGAWGFRIKHGGRIWRVGDVNGDGLNDVFAGLGVIFGSRISRDVNMSRLGRGAFFLERLWMDRGSDGAGTSVAPAGDLNGDGLADFLVGAPNTDFRGRSYAGVTHVIYGKKDHSNIPLRRLGRFGYRIGGSTAREQTGASVATIADMNGDGLREFVIGGGTNSKPKVYIVFGRP
jgi:hypothetical protein